MQDYHIKQHESTRHPPMTLNGNIATSKATIYKVPVSTPGNPNSGKPKSLAWIRIVNGSGADRTFNLYLNLNGTSRNIVPVSTELGIGYAYGDDIPPLDLEPGSLVEADASGTGVLWTISVV